MCLTAYRGSLSSCSVVLAGVSTMLDCPRREQMLRLFAAKKAGMALGWGRVEVGLSIQQVEKKTVKKIMVEGGAVSPIITNQFL